MDTPIRFCTQCSCLSCLEDKRAKSTKSSINALPGFCFHCICEYCKDNSRLCDSIREPRISMLRPMPSVISNQTLEKYGLKPIILEETYKKVFKKGGLIIDKTEQLLKLINHPSKIYCSLQPLYRLGKRL